MKKLVLLAAITFFMFAANAQFGIHAGLNVSSYSGKDATDTKSKAGFHFGVSYQIPVSNGITIQTEATYSGEGATYKDVSDDKDHINFLNLAALFRYNFNGGFNLATGPQYGFVLSAKEKYDGNTDDFKDQLKTGNFCWAFAAGYDLPMGFGVYARYNLGLSTIASDQNFDVKQSTFQFGVRYTIETNGKGK
jgi:hypothetical protein